MASGLAMNIRGFDPCAIPAFLLSVSLSSMRTVSPMFDKTVLSCSSSVRASRIYGALFRLTVVRISGVKIKLCLPLAMGMVTWPIIGPSSFFPSSSPATVRGT